MRVPITHRYHFLINAIAALCVLPLCTPAFAQGQKTPVNEYGQHELTFPLSQLLEQETIDSLAKIISPDEEITWNLYVSETYDPNKPAGLMVYISPTPKGWMPGRWRSVLDENNLIWISAHGSGNRVAIARRILFAVLGPQIAAKDYEIDSDRIYLSGFSGGGKVSSMVAIYFANLFKGAIYICGVLQWRKTSPALFSQAKDNRYVFLTGTNDFNRGLTKNIFQKYKSAGLRNIFMMDIPGLAHKLPGTKDFQKAINFLDER